MRAAHQTEYIVQCIREAASMYPEDARTFLAEHDAHVRTEALAEGAALLEDKACDADFTEDPRFIAGLREGAALLTRAAAGEQAARTADTGFFQPGHTYTRQCHGDLAEFDVRHIEPHPDGGRVAYGFYRRNPRRTWHAYTADDLGDWTDTTTRKDGPK